jgi:hypothetical protein
VQLGGRHTIYLPKAITWHNNFVEECAILSLLNIRKNAMDQQFTRKITASTEEITTIRRILLSATEGKATNLYESRDIECDGRWIVGIDSDKVEHLTVIVATTISRLWENWQILPLNQSASAPLINPPKPRRKSNKTAVSGFDNDDDDTSIQSMHSKAWSSVAMIESGSVPKSSTNRSKPKIHFVFDPESTEEFPPLPSSSTTATSPRNDTFSVGSISTVTKSDLEAFQTKLSQDLADNLKACQSLTSSVTADSTQTTALAEIRAERHAMQQENQAARNQQNEQMAIFMPQFQQMLGLFMSHRDSQFQQPQQPQPQHPHPYQQHLAQQHHLAQQQQPQSHHSPQKSQQLFPGSPQHLFTGTPPPHPQQHAHYSPEHQQGPNPRTYKRTPGPGGYFALSNPSAPPPPPPPRERPSTLPPDTTWDPYQGRIVPLNGSAAYSPPPQQPPLQERQPEEHIEFDYRQQGHTQTTDQHMPECQQKSAPGGSEPTDMTPPKKKSAGTNATAKYYANAPPGATSEHSSSESTGGVQ